MARNVKEKITISVDADMLAWADDLVQRGEYESRSAALEAAMRALHRRRMDEQFQEALKSLTDEDVAEMQALAEAGMDEWCAALDAMDGGWPQEDHAKG